MPNKHLRRHILEQNLPLPNTILTAEKSRSMAAPPKAVWEHLLSAKSIRPDEMSDGLMYRIGVLLPLSATTEEQGGKLVRHIRMGKNIHFDQVATVWHPNRQVLWHFGNGYGGGHVAAKRSGELVCFVSRGVERLGQQIDFHAGSVSSIKSTIDIGDVWRPHQGYLNWRYRFELPHGEFDVSPHIIAPDDCLLVVVLIRQSLLFDGEGFDVVGRDVIAFER